MMKLNETYVLIFFFFKGKHLFLKLTLSSSDLFGSDF